MGSNNPYPNITIRGVRQTIPPGYVLGRASAGGGPVQLIPWSHVGQQIVNAGQVFGPSNPQVQEWTAGAVSSLGSGFSIVSTQLRFTQNWTAAAVSTLGTGLSNSGGTLNAQWSAGAVTTLGTGLLLSGTTLSSTGGQWAAGNVTNLATGLSIVSSTSTYWNPSDDGSGEFTLSNGNLTEATIGSTNAWNSGRSNTSKSTGKWYFEFTCNNNNSNSGIMVGLMSAAGNLASYAGSDTHGVGWQSGGSLYQNGSQLINGTGSNGYAQGDTTAVAIDLTNNLIWVYSTQASEWNNSGTANPGTGVGGVSITTLGTAFLAFSGNPQNGVTGGTLNTGASSFAHSLPAGFTAWDSTTIATLTSNYQAGLLTTIGSGLTLSGGTLTSNYQATTVTSLGSNLTNSAGVLNLSTNITVAGTLTSTGLIKPTGTVGVQGNATGTTVQAGSIGEYMFSGSPGTGVTAVTITNASPAVITFTGHGIKGCVSVIFVNSGGALPTGISASPTVYYTVPGSITTNTFEIATSVANAFAGTAVNTSSAGSGTQFCYLQGVYATATFGIAAALQLTAGDWDVSGNVTHNIANGTATALITGMSDDAVHLDISTENTVIGSYTSASPLITSGVHRVLNGSTALVYIMGWQNSGSNNTLAGNIRARRVG